MRRCTTISSSCRRRSFRFRPWLGRRAILHPEWIDTGAVLRDIQSVIDAFGSAALMLHDGSLYAHQVLACGFEDRSDAIEIPIYDPNRPAVTYTADTPALRFERDDETVSMVPYSRYTGVLCNRYDRIEQATGRADASPLDHLLVDRSTLRASLFPLVAIFVDADEVALAVDAPDGDELDRMRGQYMDLSRGPFARVRTRYGAVPGTYRIIVFGHDETDYTLRAVVADAGGAIVDATHSATIESGGVHAYGLEVPEEGGGAIEPANGDARGPSFVGGIGAVGGVAAGALGYRALQRRRNCQRSN